jgi:uncharacterized FAD-dependent dehydrogenase
MKLLIINNNMEQVHQAMIHTGMQIAHERWTTEIELTQDQVEKINKAKGDTLESVSLILNP